MQIIFQHHILYLILYGQCFYSGDNLFYTISILKFYFGFLF